MFVEIPAIKVDLAIQKDEKTFLQILPIVRTFEYTPPILFSTYYHLPQPLNAEGVSRAFEKFVSESAQKIYSLYPSTSLLNRIRRIKPPKTIKTEEDALTARKYIITRIHNIFKDVTLKNLEDAVKERISEKLSHSLLSIDSLKLEFPFVDVERIIESLNPTKVNGKVTLAQLIPEKVLATFRRIRGKRKYIDKFELINELEKHGYSYNDILATIDYLIDTDVFGIKKDKIYLLEDEPSQTLEAWL